MVFAFHCVNLSFSFSYLQLISQTKTCITSDSRYQKSCSQKEHFSVSVCLAIFCYNKQYELIPPSLASTFEIEFSLKFLSFICSESLRCYAIQTTSHIDMCTKKKCTYSYFYFRIAMGNINCMVMLQC